MGKGFSPGDQKAEEASKGDLKGENSREENQQDVRVLANSGKKSSYPPGLGTRKHFYLKACSAAFVMTGLGGGPPPGRRPALVRATPARRFLLVNLPFWSGGI